MMLTTIFLSAAMSAPASGVTDVQFTAPAVRIAGEPYVVEQTFTSDGPVELWRFGPAAFEVDGKPLGERVAAAVDMPKGSRVTISFDLAASLPAKGGFKIGCAGAGAKTDVATYQAVPRGGVKFLDLSPEDLAKYKVLRAGFTPTPRCCCCSRLTSTSAASASITSSRPSASLSSRRRSPRSV
jgi:hypothetical protein